MTMIRGAGSKSAIPAVQRDFLRHILLLKVSLDRRHPNSSPYSKASSIDLILEAFQKFGVNYIETGPWYGQGTSERIVGEAVSQLPRDQFYIGSKVGRYGETIQERFDFSAERTEAGVDCTLNRLGLDYIDLIQVHDFTFAPDTSTIIRETLPALERAVNQGKARYIGLADYDLDIMKEVVEESEVKISTILSHSKSTLLDNRLQNYTTFFKAKGIGIINAAATGMGLLTNTGPQPWHPASDDVKELCKQASAFCVQHKVNLARLATWFSLNQTNIDTNICGFTASNHLHDTCDVAQNGLTDEEMGVLKELQTRFFNKTPLHWDGVELPVYQEELKNLISTNKS